jgi:hypothetical protein
MGSQRRQYFFGLLFLGVAVYQLVKNDVLEFSLYLLAGAAFIFNSLTLEPRLVQYKKPLVVISWILIGASGILFLYLLQFKYL